MIIKTKNMTISIVIAAVLWYVIFVLKPLNFWLSMCLGVALLVLAAMLFDKKQYHLGKIKLRHLVVGVLSAALLYGIFYVGNVVSAWILPFKDAQISSVYMNKAGTSTFLISLALLFVIGPGEEIFWRGFIQKNITDRFGAKAILLSAVLYAAVHIVTMNFMLIMASFICGLFWGAIYYREKSIYPIVISHALWDITVFLIIPFK